MENSFSDFGIGKQQAQIGKSTLNNGVQNLSDDAQQKVLSSEVIDVKAKKPITVQDLIDKGLTPEQAQKCIDENPSISSLSTDAVNSLVQKYKESPIPTPTLETAPKEIPNSKKPTGTGVDYDFKSFKAETDIKKKSDILLDEYTRNLYQKEWDTYSDEIKQQKRAEVEDQFIKSFKSDEDLDLKTLEDVFSSPDFSAKFNKLSDKEKMAIRNAMNSKMLDIQLANVLEINVKELSNPEYKDLKNGTKYDLMMSIAGNDKTALRENFSIDDVEFFREYSLAIEGYKKKYGNKAGEITGKRLAAKIMQHNAENPNDPITMQSLAFEGLNNKIKLSSEQRESFNNLLFKTKDLQGIRFQRFLRLLNKKNLTADEQQRFNRMIKDANLTEQDVNSLRELYAKSGLDTSDVDIYRDLSFKDIVTNHQLNKMADPDTSNIIMDEIKTSPVFREALKKYEEENVDNAGYLAIRDWLISEFPEGMSLEDFQAKLNSILGKSNGRTGKLISAQLKELGIFARYSNLKPDKIIASTCYDELSAEQINNMEPGEERTFYRNVAANSSTITGNYERVNEFNRTGGDIDLEYQRRLAKNYGDSDGYVENVVNDFPKNADLYCKEAQENIIRTGGTGLDGLMTEDQLNEYANNLGNYVSNSGDQDLKDLYAASRDTYTGKAYETANTRSVELGYSDKTVEHNNLVKNVADELATLISEVKQGNIPLSQVEAILAPLTYGDQIEVLSQIPSSERAKLPIKLCEKFSLLIEDFVNAGMGLDIVITCDMPTGNKAISLMMKNADERKDLAALRPERFAKNTYDELVASNIIKEPDNKDDIEPREYLG